MGEASALGLVGRPAQPGAWAAFCDFDGTITMRDTHDALMEAFVDAPTQRRLYERFHAGAANLWQLLDESLVACQVPAAEAVAHLVATVPVDPGFAPFVAWCRAEGVPVAIVSAGLHEVIEAVLAREGLEGLPVIANRAVARGGGFGLLPRTPECPTGVDKAGVLRGAEALGWRSAFVGDGVSDRLAAPVARRCYAKAGLAHWCARQGLPHVAVPGFAEVQADLALALRQG